MKHFKEFGDHEALRRVVIRRAAMLCATLVLAVIALSAFIRLSSAGLGCADWPRCYGEGLATVSRDAASNPAPGVVAARLGHRVAGGAVLVLVMLIAMTAFSKPVLAAEGATAVAMLAIVVMLAVLGVFSAGARMPAVTIGNLAGGFAILALAVRLAWPASPVAPTRLRRWALVAAALVLAQVALGGLVSAGYAGLSCPSLVDCMPGAPEWNALDPFSEPVPGTRPGALAQAVHRAGAIVLALVLVPLGVAALRRGLPGAAVLLALAGLQVALGIALVVGALPLSVALLHNAVAALIFASVVRLA